MRFARIPIALAMLATSIAQAAEQAAAPAATAAAAATTATAASPASAGSLLQVLLGLVAVLALMAGGVWLLKRMGVAGTANGNVARVVGGVSVGNRERVLVVEVADQWIVVGVAPGRVSALSSMPKQESAPTLQALPDNKNFAAWLKQTIDKRNGK
ncbi:flagellar biosynthetic protein FliO [Noviherbaspirillum sp. CPCC 100848]|uniref:Flagellar protein n=1 Tax=Noviherbaspirillum album TaxID=3080276 RepID=A0ABU6JCH9_9BURK|nr:flagellar biosynthetic protein FliO [Noviherbaspirillum sp. CPCC 100848]MEC4721361.1 flagellar biosynthetic protein FliO [Noviherbaspirillum sp. CPCC 100848]